MKIGLFLDVDKTLTCNVIQADYARFLGCEAEFAPIEEAFRQKSISSELFATRLIALFASRRFTCEFAQARYKDIALKPHVDDLLAMGSSVDIYLVSNGPSYYIEKFAKENGIRRDRVLCSGYQFDRRTDIIETCNNPVSLLAKEEFVAAHAPAYDITVAVGDSVEIDGPFMAKCTLPILVEANDAFISAQNLSAIRILLTRLLALKQAGAGTIDLKSILSLQALLRLSWDSWALLLLVASLLVGLGEWLAPLHLVARLHL